MDNRGLSELLGYVLMFSVVLVAMATVVVFGVSALDEVQRAQVADSGTFAMQTLEEDIHAIYRGSAVSRRTELNLENAALETGSATTVTIQANVGGSLEADELYTFRPIVYETEDADFVYENSLVVREQPRGAVAVTDSLVLASNERLILPVVRTEPVGLNGTAGSRGQVRTFHNGSDREVVNRDPSGPVEVTFEIQTTPGRADVWERLLKERLEDVPDPNPGDPSCVRPSDTEVRCEAETDTLVISSVTIAYELE